VASKGQVGRAAQVYRLRGSAGSGITISGTKLSLQRSRVALIPVSVRRFSKTVIPERADSTSKESGMPTRKASAVWEGGLKTGTGNYNVESGSATGEYSFARFAEGGNASNPEELLAAAEASCYSMAFSGALERNGTPPTRIATDAACTVEKVGEGFQITTMKLDVRASVPNIDDAKFQELARATLTGCPVSKALKDNMKMELNARLE